MKCGNYEGIRLLEHGMKIFESARGEIEKACGN